jgi:hypothetical protein
MHRSARFRTVTRVSRHARALAAIAALTLLPACAESQAMEAGPARAEVSRVEAALKEIESRVLRDPELMRMDEALGAELMQAMVRADPGLPAAAGQLPLLQEQYSRAIQAGDAAAAAQVNRRIATIERRYLRAQSDALQDRSLSARADRFNALLRRRMIEADADAADLLRRYAELRERMGP